MTSDIHRTVQDNLVEILRDQGYRVRKEVFIGNNRVDVFAENDAEIRIYEVVLSSDKLKEFDKSRFSKPVRVFKVYPNLRKPFERKHKPKLNRRAKRNQRAKVHASIDEEVLDGVRKLVDSQRFRNISHAFEYCAYHVMEEER